MTQANQMPDSDNVRTLYAKLHIAGITHGDIQLRHIRRRLDDPSQLVLIDFDQAKINDAVSMKEEKKNLKCFLSFGVPDEELDEDSDDGTKTEYP
jgi:tRNA A-37 threonylcarbamoyl transferase component Bud32